MLHGRIQPLSNSQTTPIEYWRPLEQSVTVIVTSMDSHVYLRKLVIIERNITFLLSIIVKLIWTRQTHFWHFNIIRVHASPAVFLLFNTVNLKRWIFIIINNVSLKQFNSKIFKVSVCRLFSCWPVTVQTSKFAARIVIFSYLDDGKISIWICFWHNYYFKSSWPLLSYV